MKSCNIIAVPYYTQWSAYGACDSSCGDGLQKRTRNCTDITGANRGQDCGPDLENEKACVGLPECVVTSNPCDAPVNPCLSDGVSHTCRLQSGGTFKCKCKDGYVNDAAGKYCVNENECNRVINDCKDLNTKTLKQGVASCKDTVGSYDCVCASGFTYNSTSRVCTDVDECSTGAHNCDITSRATCTNTPGSFTCRCLAGYQGAGTTGTCKENRLLSFTGHSKLSSSAIYSDYLAPNFAMKVGGFLYPSFYFTRGGLILFTTVTSDTKSSGVRRPFTNPSKFSLDPSFQEKAAFAPWWSNLITGTDAKSGVYYKEFSSDVPSENTVIQGEKRDFSSNYAGFSMSSPKYMIIITWNKMELSKNPRANAETVTFQLVMITDYENTYVKVIYNDREMTWDVLNSVGNYPVRIGVLKQNETAEEYPQSYLNLISSPQDKSKIEKIDEVIPTGLTGDVSWKRKGFSYYKISGSGGISSHPGLQCSSFLTTKRSQLSNPLFSVKTDEVSKCPPSLLQKTDSLVAFSAAGIPSSIICFGKRSALSSTAKDERTPRCCYDRSNKGLIMEATIAKGFNTYMVRKPSSAIQTTADQAFDTCCNAENSYASKSDQCSEYLNVLPVCSSENFVASGAGGALGDPHLTSLDGLSFTFNGHGEFVLLKATNVEVQGRFSPQRNAAGVKSATFISGIAGQQSNPASAKVEFRLDANSNDTEILINGVLQNVDLSSGAADFLEVTVTKETDSKGVSTWKMIFSGGLTAGVQLTNKMFQLVISASASYRTQFEGQNTENNTLFTYGGSASNANWTSHIDTSYTPVFFNANLTVMFPDPSKRSTAISTCNSGKSTDSDPEKRKECYFDFKVTENAALAASTSDTKTALAETQSALANYPPEIKNGNVTIEVTVGGNYSLVLNAVDENEGDTIFFLLNSDAPSGVTVNNATKTLTWVGVPDSNSMSIKITVSDGKAQSLWTPKIKLCKCKNGATCGFGVESSEQFFIVPCTCVKGYDGTYCENDEDGCASRPCWPGVDCTDVLARDLSTTPAGFTCGSCPSHLDGDGITCSDNDECQLKTDNCDKATTTCTNTVGSFTCECKKGYTRESATQCTDINECDKNPCPANSRCQNTVGSYTCTCNYGYQLNTQSNQCEDKDECAGSNNCQQRCIDGVGTYTCGCNTGYRLNETDLISCLPENECTSQQKATCDGGNPRTSCAVLKGDVYCTCPSGFALNATKYCIDIDECATNVDICVDSKSDCVNREGGYRCQCKAGYKNQGDFACADIDECTSGNNCTSPATCSNTDGSYACVCPSGYTKSGQYGCSDINECASSATHNCDKQYGTCSNTPGGYGCSCNKGFTGNGYVCADLNECATKNNCTQKCSNAIGSYTCSCFEGYTLAADGLTCNDNNECTDSAANGCFSNAYCTNTQGSYTCSCPSDYILKGDGKTCEYANECILKTAECPANSQCINLDPGYSCQCSSGYQKNGSLCQDINECDGANDCNSKLGVCNNNAGGYSCSCKTGYSGDGRTCVDVDECAGSHGCGQLCKNLPGGFECQCQQGYRLEADQKTCVAEAECDSAKKKTCQNELCAKLNGTQTCQCPPGFVLDTNGTSCNDTDECLASPCYKTNSRCENTVGSYNCSCINGFILGPNNVCKDRNGGLSSWTVWGNCTKPCGSGTSTRTRACDNPTKEGFGADCVGERSQSKPCNTQVCPTTTTQAPTTQPPTTSTTRPTIVTGPITTSVFNSSQPASNVTQPPTSNPSTDSSEPASNVSQSPNTKPTIPTTTTTNGPTTTTPNLCDGFTCQNGGACVVIDGSPRCQCNASYTGNVCQYAVPYYTQWSAYGPCDSSCGDGLQKRTRNCTDITGANRGQDCGADLENEKACVGLPECVVTSNPCDAPVNPCLSDGVSHTCRLQAGGAFKCKCKDGYVNDAAGKYCVRQNTKNNSLFTYGGSASNADWTSHVDTSYTPVFFNANLTVMFPDPSKRSTAISLCNSGKSTDSDPEKRKECYFDFKVTENAAVASSTSNTKAELAETQSTLDNNECQLKTDNCDKATTTCTNTVGSFTCECKKGYSKESASKCTDINECDKNPCPANSRCQNTVGSYTCTCNYGYQLNTQSNQCEDKDECAGSNNCQQKCIDGVGTYTCGCNTGYRLNTTDLISCLPENECTAQQKATCDGGNPRTSCAVLNGDVYCTCPSGFALNATKYCIDIDECATNVDICVDSQSDCVNREGGYRCQCKAGYKNQGDFACADAVTSLKSYPFADIDECTSGNNCTSPATCSNTVGSYTCVCPNGYTKSTQFSCSDVNECASAATHGCDKEYGTCSNTPGGYTCSCNKGFTGTGYVCADVNECSDSAANGCYNNAHCTNTQGSYTCSCPANYRLKGDGKTCESIFKCADNHGCSHTCGKINSVDTCSCPSGMELDSTNKTCVDTNECASSSTNVCKAANFVVCANTNGSYVCNCVNNSYVKSQESVCVDANECILRTANCPANSACVNQNPGYECRCLTGYQKVGSLCTDINECSGSNDCHPTLATCSNSPGGYSCACKAGYSGDGRTCTDVNECTLNTHNCDSRSDRRTCTNTPGSFTCGCVSGYQLAGDRRTCNDVDECAGSSHGCSQICKNTDGGFECKCQSGYRLEADQKTCVVEAECGAAKKATCFNQMCAKVNGTDTCQCPPGYELGSNGTSCNGSIWGQLDTVYRHGDRSPIVMLPKDTHQLDDWPNGLGWLSKIGMSQHHALGQWLRNRYTTENTLLNKTYKHKEIQIDSSNENRCLMSAYSNLAGLYPPTEEEMFDPSLKWQPIPVHTRPEKEDNVINMGMSCPRYDELLTETIASKEVQTVETKNKEFYNKVENYTGLSGVNINSLWMPADTLFCEKAHNLTLDSWAYEEYNNMTIYERLRKLDAWQFHLLYYNIEMAKLKGGPLLKEMRENMNNRSSKANYTGPKLYMFSGHDTTVAALLSALGLYKDIPASPGYAACVMLELYKTENYYYVEIHYKNNHQMESNASTILRLKGCEKKCKLEKFLSLTDAAVPKDWRKECYTRNPPSRSGIHLSTSEIISIVMAVVLIVTLVCLIVTCVKLKRTTSEGYKTFVNS
uniref:Fibrillin-2 n=1 Tax=Magallana gigas TaxID=29159 RepID=K1QGK1_MAGGI